MTNTPTIEVPRAWLEGFVNFTDSVTASQQSIGPATRERLLEYIKAARALLDK